MTLNLVAEKQHSPLKTEPPLTFLIFAQIPAGKSLLRDMSFVVRGWGKNGPDRQGRRGDGGTIGTAAFPWGKAVPIVLHLPKHKHHDS